MFAGGSSGPKSGGLFASGLEENDNGSGDKPGTGWLQMRSFKAPPEDSMAITTFPGGVGVPQPSVSHYADEVPPWEAVQNLEESDGEQQRGKKRRQDWDWLDRDDDSDSDSSGSSHGWKKKKKKHKKDSDGKRKKDKKKRKRDKRLHKDQEKEIKDERRAMRADPRAAPSGLGGSTTDYMRSRTSAKSESKADNEGSRPYEVDRKGDKNNILFESINPAEVPSFRYPRGVSLLASAREGGMRGASWDVEKADASRMGGSGRYWGEKYQSEERDKDARRLDLSKGSVARATGAATLPAPLASGFVPIERLEPEMDDGDNGKGKGEDSDEPERKADGNAGAIVSLYESYEEYSFRRQKEFNQRLRENPRDVDGWMSFVQFQQDLIRVSGGRRRMVSASMEKIVAIYRRALDANPDSEILACGYLAASKDITEWPRLERSWQRFLRERPYSHRLWTEYIDTRLSHFPSMTLTTLRLIIGDSLNKCDMERRSAASSHLALAAEDTMFSIVVRAATVEWSAGFTERAIGILQGMSELNSFCPLPLQGRPPAAKMSMLEAFWESDCPRVGDDPAKYQSGDGPTEGDGGVMLSGFREWYDRMQEYAGRGLRGVIAEGQGENAPIEPTLPPPGDDEDAGAVFGHWAAEEEKQVGACWAPILFHQEGASRVTDAERMVLFEDIDPYLFTLQSTDLQRETLFRLLYLVGVKPIVEGRLSSNHRDIHYYRSVRVDTKCSHFSDLLAGKNVSSDSLWIMDKSLEYQRLDASAYRFASNIFRRLIREWPRDIYVKVHFLNFVSAHDYQMAQSLAKEMLEADRFCLELWNAYAQVLVRNGDVKQSRKIYNNAMAMISSLAVNHPARAHASMLYRAYAEMELQENGQDSRHAALCILTAAVEAEAFIPPRDKKGALAKPPASTRLLRARNSYRTILLEMSAIDPPPISGTSSTATHQAFGNNTFGDFLVSFAWFEYLTVGIHAGRAVFEDAWEVYGPREAPSYRSDATISEKIGGSPVYELSRQLEDLFLAYVRMMKYHAATCRPVPPYLLREVLEKVMKAFPFNETLLRLYVDIERKSRIAGRVRKLFDHIVSNERPSPVIVWEHYILAELQRLLDTSLDSEFRLGSKSRVWNLFERAVAHPHVAQASHFWRMYMECLLHQGLEKRAKRIFFRAAQACGWCKSIWQLPMQLPALRALFTDEELSDLIGVMEEKELRLRVDVSTLL